MAKESIYFILEILSLLSYWKFVVFGKRGELFEV
jgi:hypothetical protein